MERLTAVVDEKTALLTASENAVQTLEAKISEANVDVEELKTEADKLQNLLKKSQLDGKEFQNKMTEALEDNVVDAKEKDELKKELETIKTELVSAKTENAKAQKQSSD